MVVSSNKDHAEQIQNVMKKFLNFAHIHEENKEIILRSFYRTQQLTLFKAFKSSRQENLSQIIFPDKAKNLHGFPLYIAYSESSNTKLVEDKFVNKWLFYLNTVAEKLNATLKYREIKIDFRRDLNETITNSILSIRILLKMNELDFLTDIQAGYDLNCYNYVELCISAPLPPKVQNYEMILILPLDKSCWMWLGLTVTLSAVVWRILEGRVVGGAHSKFLFGSCALFLGHFSKVPT